MAPGFKYHVVTIAAIFFALTVGLVYGGLFVSPRIANLAERQARLFATAQAQMRADLKARGERIDHDERCLAVMLPSALKGRLAGVPVAIVQTGDYSDATARVREALQMADARVASVTTIGHNFDKPDELLVPMLANLRTGDARFPSSRTGLAESLAGVLSRGDLAGDSAFLPALEREGFLHAEDGSDYLLPVRFVVIVAGSRIEFSTRPGNVDQPLVAALQRRGLTVIMGEPLDAKASDVDAYRKLNLDVTTIDNVDTDVGRCALVLAFGVEKGSFGVKPTAGDLMPADTSRAGLHF